MGWDHIFQEHLNAEKWRKKSQFRPSMSYEQIKHTIGTTILKGVAKRPKKNRIIFEYQADEYVGYSFKRNNCEIVRCIRVVLNDEFKLITAYPITAWLVAFSIQTGHFVQLTHTWWHLLTGDIFLKNTTIKKREIKSQYRPGLSKKEVVCLSLCLMPHQHLNGLFRG